MEHSHQGVCSIWNTRESSQPRAAGGWRDCRHGRQRSQIGGIPGSWASWRAGSPRARGRPLRRAPAPGSSTGSGTTLEYERREIAREHVCRGGEADGAGADDVHGQQDAAIAGWSAMGIHFFRPDLLGIIGTPSPRVSGTGTHTDFRRPSILIYEPQADGSLDLVAVEKTWPQRSAMPPGRIRPVAHVRKRLVVG